MFVELAFAIFTIFLVLIYVALSQQEVQQGDVNSEKVNDDLGTGNALKEDSLKGLVKLNSNVPFKNIKKD